MTERRGGPDFWRELPARLEALISIIPGCLVALIGLYVLALALW